MNTSAELIHVPVLQMYFLYSVESHQLQELLNCHVILIYGYFLWTTNNISYEYLSKHFQGLRKQLPTCKGNLLQLLKLLAASYAETTIYVTFLIFLCL